MTTNEQQQPEAPFGSPYICKVTPAPREFTPAKEIHLCPTSQGDARGVEVREPNRTPTHSYR